MRGPLILVLVTLALGMASSGWAQSEAEPEPEPQQPRSAERRTEGIEEITVTARKKEESVQERVDSPRVQVVAPRLPSRRCPRSISSSATSRAW